VKSLIRWLREALGTTPGRYRLTSVTIAVLLVAAGVASLAAASGLSGSTDAIRERNGPVLVASRRLVASLAEANAAATAAFLAGGEGDPAQLQRYDEALTQATTELEQVASLAGEDPEVHQLVAEVSVGITRYGGLVEAARAQNRAAVPGGAQYLIDANTLLSDDVNVKAGQLTAFAQDRLDEEAEGRTRRLVIPVVLGSVGLLGLVVSQIFVTRRSRRLVNPPLVAATALVVIAGGWLLAAAVTSDEQVDRARTERYQAIARSADMQAAAHQARSATLLELITDDPAWGEQAEALEARVVAGGALDDLWRAYVDAADLTAATEAFDQFSAEAESLLQDNQSEFVAGLDDAGRSLRWLSLGTLALGLLAAAMALVGFQARINEYW
jgi:CHASE3 domain sensor protein